MREGTSFKSLQTLLESTEPVLDEFGATIRVGMANMTLADQLLRIVNVTGVDERGAALPSSLSALKLDPARKSLTGKISF